MLSFEIERLLALLWLAGAGGVVFVLFLAPTGTPSAPSAIISIVSLIFSGLGLRAFWRSQQPRQLVWDGARWALDGPASGQDGGGPARVQVGFDGQRVLLLRWDAPTRRRGAWLCRLLQPRWAVGPAVAGRNKVC